MSGHGVVATGRARRVRRGWQWGVVAAALATASLVAPVAAGAAPTHDGAAPTHEGVATSVIVRATHGHLHDAEAVVSAAGGQISRELSIIDGFAAVVPADALATISASSVVLSVSDDAPLTPMSLDSKVSTDTSVSSGSTGTARATDAFNSVATSPVSNVTNTLGSLWSVTRIIGANKLWNAGYTGKGVDVALIDTGVAPVPGLTDNVVNGPDLSFDYQSGAPAGVDAYGHGTHMAGIIAGHDSDATVASDYSDPTKFAGVAPDARIVNVKVGAFNGATDVSQVIAAIDWVVQHRNDNGMNIRVLNLSFGTDSQQSWTIDPLAYATDVAWRHGIVVVAAAGNDGTAAPSLSDPAYDPRVIAVGASDSQSLKPGDSVVAPFTSGGSNSRGVDIVAPGTHILSLRDPGSFVDQSFPDSQVGTRFTLGSGTSQAAAVTSGFVADLAQRYPNATPNQLKALILGTATKIHHPNGTDDGNGILNGGGALTKGLPQNASQGVPFPTGTGSLEAARGTYHVVADGTPLVGEQDIFGSAWDGARWSADSWNGTSWAGGTWNGARWSGDTWSGSDWTNTAWDGTDWAGARWSGARWSGARWSGARWSGARWSGARWSGQRWSDAGWDGQRWSAVGFSDVDWN